MHRGLMGVVALVLLAVAGCQTGDRPAAPAAAPEPDFVSAPPVDELQFKRVSDPARTLVVDAGGKTLAVFTDKARTVRLTGPSRTFAEQAHTSATITTDAWIRLAPRPWQKDSVDDTWVRPWLEKALDDRSPDALAIAMEYVDGAKRDASFGPLSNTDPDGRAERSDFYDYLGVDWEFPDGKKERPDPDHIRSLDCSGFLRMVYGYRMGYPLRGTNTPGTGLPRRAYAIAEFGPGAQLMPNRGTQAREYERLNAGDLVFFNGGPVLNDHIEHMGMYLGVDSNGRHRFISSRTKADGPTLGDTGGDSLLDGSGHYGVRFRTARRI
ncbi:NlpC/P60 family protein [Phytohabitans sp. LJ34]|uniref:NlpC/P60 family protein n=1 Tax=Phytohabitans sp. LJ34 TaxID=3452217 RepID=UPI003F8ACF4E